VVSSHGAAIFRACSVLRGAPGRAARLTARRRQELKGNIRVFARVRPSDERCALSIDDENGTIAVPYGGTYSNFKFDRAFAPLSTQEVRLAAAPATRRRRRPPRRG
jgi:hypothetical protein